MKKVYLTKGLPGSGKSTWAKDKIRKKPNTYKRVNKDDLRAMLDAGHFTSGNEKFVLKMRDAVILAALEAGKHVIVDDTNLHPKHEKRIQELVKGVGEVEVVDFMDVSIETCIKRDLMRANSVGERVIRRMWAEYLDWNPDLAVQDPELPKAIICDLDGTLALISHRSPFDASNCDEDDLNVPVAKIVQAFAEKGHKILFVSGREDKYEAPTRVFIAKHLGEDFAYELIMRKAGDSRKDSIVKREFYDERIQPNYYVEFVLDDRNQVVDMWRGIGITCLQVAYGDF